MATPPKYTEQTYGSFPISSQYFGDLTRWVETFSSDGLQEQITQNAEDIAANTEAINDIPSLPSDGLPDQMLVIDSFNQDPKWFYLTPEFINAQPVDAGLTSIAGLVTSADKMIYTTASDVYATTDITSFARTLLDDADAATMRTTLDAEQAFVKNTAFNKNFGALATDVATGNRGILAGGTANQVMEKIDGTDYNVQWVDAGGGGAALDVQLNGVSVTDPADTINFSGAGVGSITDSPAGQANVVINSGVGGAVELVSSAVVTVAQANIDLSLAGPYDYFTVEVHLMPVTNGANLTLKVTEDDFATVVGGSDYRWVDARVSTTHTITTDQSDSLIRLATNIGNTSIKGFAGQVMVDFPLDSTKPTTFTSRASKVSSSNSMQYEYGGGRYQFASVVDGIRLAFSSGNIAVGSTVYLYGHRKIGGISSGTMASQDADDVAITGGVIDLTGKLSTSDTTDSTSPTTGSIQTDGGLGVAKRLNVGTDIQLNGGNLFVNNTAGSFADIEFGESFTGTRASIGSFNGNLRYKADKNNVQGSTNHEWYIDGTSRMKLDNTTTAGNTALLLWDVDNATLERVTVGTADSGGVGFKVLRIPN